VTPLIVASLAVMNEAMVAGMIDHVVAQGSVPPICTGRSTPMRVQGADEANKERAIPNRRRGCGHETWQRRRISPHTA
jgi:hypothetical protein